MSELLDDLLDAWKIHNDINLFLLRWLPPRGLAAVTLLKTGKPSTGRNVGRIFAHMHEVRAGKLPKAGLLHFSGDTTPDAKTLGQALERSGDAVATAVRAAVENGQPLSGWKRPPAIWVAYLISHESHHRGRIAQALKQSGVRPPEEVSYGIWGYWGGYALKEPKRP